MRPHALAAFGVATLLASHAQAQSNGWDFGAKATAAKPAAVVKVAPAPASATPPPTAPARNDWAFADNRTAATAAASVAAKPVTTTPVPPKPEAAKPDTAKREAAKSVSTKPAVKATAAKASFGVTHTIPGRTEHITAPAITLLWQPLAGHTPVTPHEGVILNWSTGTPASDGPDGHAVVSPAAVIVPVRRDSASAPQSKTIVEPRKPQPTGLERLSDDWPKAVSVGIQYRGRLEEQRGSVATAGRDDDYYLNRIRLQTTVLLAPWAKAYVQMQDSQTLGYDVAAQPAGLTNTFDMRQGYLELHAPPALGASTRIGRQDLFFGEQRLIGKSEWGNTSRSFDAARVSVTRPGVHVDAFSGSVVAVTQGAFDRRKAGESFSGAYVSLDRLVPKSVVEPYVLGKLQRTAAGELGGAGDGATYTVGLRAAGALPHHLDYGVEVAVQRGHLAADAVDAWAGHYALGWTLAGRRDTPRVFVEFNQATGDDDPRDGRRQTFDQLYASNRTNYGITEQVGWKNMRAARIGMALAPSAKLKLNVDVHQLWLATAADGLYAAGGARKVLNRAATSATIGREFDLQSSYAFSKELSFAAGVGTLFAGRYLTQSTGGGTVWTPYAMWNVTF